jgi:hypothetical protein
VPGAVWFPGARINYAENIFNKMRREVVVKLWEALPTLERTVLVAGNQYPGL